MVFCSLLAGFHMGPTPKQDYSKAHASPADTRRSSKIGKMLGQRRRRWANIKPVLGECIVFEKPSTSHQGLL